MGEGRDKIIDGFKGLYAGAIADVLNAMGCYGSMDPQIRPIFSGVKICGRALTIKAVPARKTELNKYRSIHIEAKEACKPNDVIVIDTGGSYRSTIWGENSCTACKTRGASGVVIDGACRDIASIKEMKFPVFCSAISPGISKDALVITAYNVPIECGGVAVRNRDVIYGDDDGVVVIPQEIAEETLLHSISYAQLDGEVARRLRAGSSVAEAYKAREGALKF